MMKTNPDYHLPALLHESIDLLEIRKDGTYVDVTFGGGGHSREILRRLGPGGKLIAFDKDVDALQNKIEDTRLELVKTDFKFIEKVLKGMEIEAVDGILGDLGISSHQIDEPTRGFSFRFDAELDMRMDQDAEISAVEVLNDYPEVVLQRIFRVFGEIRQARRIAEAVVRNRKSQAITTTGDLARIVGEVVQSKNLNKILTLVYQAIRIEVNREMEALQMLLTGGLNMLAVGGRMSIISYHSLEDRMVKQFFRHGNLEGEDRRDMYGRPLTPWKVITRKAVKPTEAEVAENSRARSARLRAAEKVIVPGVETHQ